MSAASGLEHLKPFLPGLESALEDSEVSEIMINGPGNVWVERAGRLPRFPRTRGDRPGRVRVLTRPSDRSLPVKSSRRKGERGPGTDDGARRRRPPSERGWRAS